MIEFNTTQQIRLKVSTSNFTNGEGIKMSLEPLDENKTSLGKKNTHASVTNGLAQHVFTIKALANELHIDISKIAYVAGWIDKDNDGVVDGNEVVYLKVKQCFCHRDFTVDEVKKIVKELRASENISNTNLFTASNCHIPSAEKNYERFTEELNKMMNKYEINTCIRKAHFLAQAYHETDRLKTTAEYASGNQYNPGQHPKAIQNGNTHIGDGPKYKGRGLMQLTWKNNYIAYHNAQSINCVTNYGLISDDILNAVDSGGWFWLHGSSWGNLNPKADKDDIYYINIGVNGGNNGFQERIKYIKKLINIMHIKNCANLTLTKEIGKYKLSESAMFNTAYVQNHPNIKAHLEAYDD